MAQLLIALFIIAIISAYLGISFWALVVGIVGLLIIVVILIVVFTDEVLDKEEWHGQMRCSSCNYQWQSMRNTPPAKCAKCSSKSIYPMQVSKYKAKRKK